MEAPRKAVPVLPPLDPPFRRRFHSAARRFGQAHVASLDRYSLLRREPAAGLPHRVPAHSDVSREGIDGFDLYLTDATAVHAGAEQTARLSRCWPS